MATTAKPEYPSGTSFRVYGMTVTDATDSFPIPPGTLFCIVMPDAGSVGVNVHGVSNTENTVRTAETGFTNDSIPVAAGAESMPFPVKGWAYLILDGIASTCAVSIVCIKGDGENA